MTTFNTEFAEIVQTLEWADKELQAVGIQQIVKGKERVCCRMCGFCPDALADPLRSFLMQYGGSDMQPSDSDTKSRKAKAK